MQKRILITGATGFVGIHLIRKILKQDYSITCLIKKDNNYLFNKNLEEIKGHPIKIIYGDITRKETLSKIGEQDILIHLAAAVGSVSKKENYKVNIIGSKNMLGLCKKNKINRIISFGSVAGIRKFKGIYGETKNKSEEIFLESGLDITIFRPTMIYGKESKGFNKIIKYTKLFPLFIPLVGNGKYLRQPVYVEDVVDAILSSIKTSKSIDKIYNLAGPEKITFREIISKVSTQLNINKITIPIPIFFCKFLALILEKVSSKPAITMREIISINQNTTMDIESTRKDLNFNPISIDQGIKMTLK
ncbi:NAD(P)-dependent oxidoreductase [Candidatus Woesearchaeota archaeon]|nr:NAD(P)-dependent oxidoreductase [Candidatus Woesearchaeota archaeon]